MPNNPNTTHEIFSSRIKVPASQYIGQAGRMFYHEDSGELRLSDGVTPGGLPIYFSSSGTGEDLNLYQENGFPVTSPLAIGLRSIALGDGSSTQNFGGVTQASGIFSSPGDAQVGSYVARGITTNSTFTELMLDGAVAKLLVFPESTMNFIINIVARRTDIVGQESGAYEIRGGVDRGVDVSTTRIVGLTSTTLVAEDNPGAWDAKVEADAFNGALRIKVQGQNGKTIRWVAHIQTVEVHK